MIKFREHLDLLSKSEILGLRIEEAFIVTPFELKILKDTGLYTIYDLVNCNIVELRDKLKNADSKKIYYSSLYILLVERIHQLGFMVSGEEELIKDLKSRYESGLIDLSNIVSGSSRLKSSLRGIKKEDIRDVVANDTDNRFVGLNSVYNQFYVYNVCGIDIEEVINYKLSLGVKK